MGRISMPQGKGSQLHNRREYEKIGKPIPENINPELTPYNITLVDLDIKAAYENIFGEALREYNGKQTRSDRKIDNYYEHIQKSKNGEKLFYEDVLQWGKMEDFQNNPQLRETAKEALLEYAQGFQRRNPNLRLIGAYLHVDEASPHLHLDYVPVAHGYSRGLSMRNSLDRAMKEMGFVPEKESKKNNATKLWKENERAIFGEICRNRGLEVEAERKARGSLSVEEYKEAREEMMSGIEEERELAIKQVNLLANASLKLSDPNRTEPVEITGKMFTPVPELVRRSESLANEIEGRNALKNDLESQIDDLSVLRDKTKGETQKAQNELENVQKISKHLADEERGGIRVYDAEIPDGILRKKSVVVVESELDAHQVRDIFKANALTKGAVKEAADIVEQGKEEAEKLLQNSQNEIAEARNIISQRDTMLLEARQIKEKAERERKSILAIAEEKAKEIVSKAQEFFENLKVEISNLLSRKEVLQKEVDSIERSRSQLEPLRQEVASLQRSYDILSKNVENEYTRATFRNLRTLPGSYTSYREDGRLIALYKDGTQRQVGSNSYGGMDDKTLRDQEQGLCEVGVFMKEREVKVPESLFRELVAAKEPEKAISQNLQNLINQETHVEKHVQIRHKHR